MLQLSVQTTYCLHLSRFDSASSQSEVFKLLETDDLEAAEHGDSELHFGRAQQRQRAAALARDAAVAGGTIDIQAAAQLSGSAGDSTDGSPGPNLAGTLAGNLTAVPDEAAPGPWQQVRDNTEQ